MNEHIIYLYFNTNINILEKCQNTMLFKTNNKKKVGLLKFHNKAKKKKKDLYFK